MKSIFTVGVAAFLLMCTSMAGAAEQASVYQNEFTGATSAQFLFNGDLGQIKAEAGYHRSVIDFLQVGATTSIQHIFSTGSATRFALQAGPTFNLLKLEEAFFLRLLPGFILAGTSGSSSQVVFAFDALVGKRIPLFSHVSWSPYAGYSFIGSDNHLAVIVPFAFSILF